MSFGNKRGQDKLYKQWVSHGDITPETRKQRNSTNIPETKNDSLSNVEEPRDDFDNSSQYRDIKIKATKSDKQKPNNLYILLAVSVVLICVGLVIILKIL